MIRIFIFMLFILTALTLRSQNSVGLYYGYNNFQNMKHFSQDRYYPTNGGGMINFGLYYSQFLTEKKGLGLELIVDSKVFNFIDNQTLLEVQQRDDIVSIGLMYLQKEQLTDKLSVQYNTGLVFSNTIDREFFFIPGETIDDRFTDIAATNYQKIGLMADIPISYHFKENLLVSLGVRLNLDLLIFNGELDHNRYLNFPIYMKVGYRLGKNKK